MVELVPNGSKIVVVGQGYVGLPLAQAATHAGYNVVGFEVSETRVGNLNRGVSHVDDISADELGEMLALGYRATSDPKSISDADVAIICVPTPLHESGGPDLSAVRSAVKTIGANMKTGCTVILESTTYPGTTEEVVLPLLESESGMRHSNSRHQLEDNEFFLAFSPERIDPGSADWDITNTPKLVGGLNDVATQYAVSFYSRFIDRVIPMSGSREAETAKLLENTYRHVNIALVNEMARFCHDLNIDIWEVIRGASTKPFGFQKFTPGPGVGGHCIPIDPNYLSYQVKQKLGYQFKFVELAQEVNNSMPSYIVDRATSILNEGQKSLNGSTVLLLGVTYKKDIADQRESPATAIGELLVAKKANLEFHDPLVDQWQLGSQTISRVDSLATAVKKADLVILLQAHSAYDISTLASDSNKFFDTRGGNSGRDIDFHSL